MKIRALVNAGVVVETADLRLVIDPWLTNPIHYGAWHIHPIAGPGLREMVGPVDYIILSHCHQDHANPTDIKWLLERNPNAEVLICFQQYDVLGKILKREGIPYRQTDGWGRGETEIRIQSCARWPTDIDSVVCVRHRLQTIVHWNDVGYEPSMIQWARNWCDDAVTVALIPYAGASDWPQQYYDDPEQLRIAAGNKRADGLAKYAAIRKALDPKVGIPFSSGYVLGGKNWRLNEWRGNADATDVLKFDPAAVVLKPGVGTFDLETMQAHGTRDYPNGGGAMMIHAASLEDYPYDYENDPDVDQTAFPALLMAAYERAIKRSEVADDHWFYIQLGAEDDLWFGCNANRDNPGTLYTNIRAQSPRHEISMDPRALYGMLTGKYHHNNLAAGSHIKVRRMPDMYSREVNDFLTFFHV